MSRPEERVDFIVVRVDPAHCGQRAQPEIPLAFTCAGEKVTPSQTSVDHPGQTGHRPVLFGPVCSTHLQVLQVIGVINVDHNRLFCFLQLTRHIDEAARGEGDVSAFDQLLERFAVGQPQLSVRVVARNRHRARQHHLHVVAQDSRQLPGADGGAGHLRPHRVSSEYHRALGTLPARGFQHRREATGDRRPKAK